MRKFLYLPVLSLVWGCDVPLDPLKSRVPSVQLDISLCNVVGDPDWVAVRNEGATWTLLAASRRVQHLATPRLSLAYGKGMQRWVLHASAAELAELQCDRRPPQTITIAGSAVLDTSVGLMVNGTFVSESGSATFTLGAPEQPFDVVAITFSRDSASTPRHAIIRRDVAPIATMAVLDFTSAEAVPFDSALLQVTGVPTGLFDRDLLFYQEVGGHEQTLMFHRLFHALPRDAFRYYALPTGVLEPDESHVVSIRLSEGTRMDYHYRVARDTSLQLGPPARDYTVTPLSSEPCFRARVEAPSQTEYNSFVRATFYAYGTRGSTEEVTRVMLTRGYLGETPSVWRVELPDLSPRSDCLVGRGSVGNTASLRVFSGRLALNLGGSPHPPEVTRSSGAP